MPQASIAPLRRRYESCRGRLHEPSLVLRLHYTAPKPLTLTTDPDPNPDPDPDPDPNPNQVLRLYYAAPRPLLERVLAEGFEAVTPRAALQP